MVKMLVPLALLHTHWIRMAVWRMEVRNTPAHSWCKITQVILLKARKSAACASILWARRGSSLAKRYLLSPVTKGLFPLGKAMKWHCLFSSWTELWGTWEWLYQLLACPPGLSTDRTWTCRLQQGSRYQSWELPPERHSCFYLFRPRGSEALLVWN